MSEVTPSNSVVDRSERDDRTFSHRTFLVLARRVPCCREILDAVDAVKAFKSGPYGRRLEGGRSRCRAGRLHGGGRRGGPGAVAVSSRRWRRPRGGGRWSRWRSGRQTLLAMSCSSDKEQQAQVLRLPLLPLQELPEQCLPLRRVVTDRDAGVGQELLELAPFRRG